jgi:hypothetical protein
MTDQQPNETSDETKASIMATTLFDLYQQWLREGKPVRVSQDA